MGKQPGGTTQKNFRLSDETLRFLDDIAKHFTDTMGVDQNRSDAIRYCAKQTHDQLFGPKKAKK